MTDLITVKTDELIGDVLVRRWTQNGNLIVADVFNSTGWRDTRVKTERGIQNAVRRLNK